MTSTAGDGTVNRSAAVAAAAVSAANAVKTMGMTQVSFELDFILCNEKKINKRVSK